MDIRAEVREFLTTMRSRLTPEQVGIPTGPHRRVAGLRRIEVAASADISVEYYTRLERGNIRGASDAVLDAVGKALRLDDAERAHLFDLARIANHSPAVGARRRLARDTTIHPTLQLALDVITAAPAFVRNYRMDVVAANALGHAFHSELNDSCPRRNLARFIFLDPQRSTVFYPDWGQSADEIVSSLRAEAGRDPYDKDLQDLIGELATRSSEFSVRWARHNVRRHGTGRKYYYHPIVGDLVLSYVGLDVAYDPGLTMIILAPEPGSPSLDAIRMLASWAASQVFPESESSHSAASPGLE